MSFLSDSDDDDDILFMGSNAPIFQPRSVEAAKKEEKKPLAVLPAVPISAVGQEATPVVLASIGVCYVPARLEKDLAELPRLGDRVELVMGKSLTENVTVETLNGETLGHIEDSESKQLMELMFSEAVRKSVNPPNETMRSLVYHAHVVVTPSSQELSLQVEILAAAHEALTKETVDTLDQLVRQHLPRGQQRGQLLVDIDGRQALTYLGSCLVSVSLDPSTEAASTVHVGDELGIGLESASVDKLPVTLKKQQLGFVFGQEAVRHRLALQHAVPVMGTGASPKLFTSGAVVGRAVVDGTGNLTLPAKVHFWTAADDFLTDAQVLPTKQSLQQTLGVAFAVHDSSKSSANNDIKPAAAPSSSAAKPTVLTPLGVAHASVRGLNHHNKSNAVSLYAGKKILLEREPNNYNDSNAIAAIDESTRKSIGHVERGIALQLAPILDSTTGRSKYVGLLRNLQVDAVLLGSGDSYQVPIKITLSAKSDHFLSDLELGPALKYVRGHLKSNFVRSKSTSLDHRKPPPDSTNHQLVPAGAVKSHHDDDVDGPAIPEALSPIVRALAESLLGRDMDRLDNNGVEKMTISTEQQQQELDKMFDDQMTRGLADLPNYKMPKQLQQAGVTLYDYQQVGIRWLIHQERTNDPAPYLKPINRKTKAKKEGDELDEDDTTTAAWLCEITRIVRIDRPLPLRGGILADDMGLGKTLQIIALILSNPPKGQSGYPYQRRGLGAKATPRCTLIVSPVSVISNWKIQINKFANHRHPDKNLKVHLYHGSNRQNELEEAKANQVDILLTSYHTLVSDRNKYLEHVTDLKKAHRPNMLSQPRNKKRKTQENDPTKAFIFEIDFHRVVLDEAHIIRNSSTGFFKAMSSLKADNKFCLTGTPYVNRPEDIHSLLAFLGVDPLGSKRKFNEYVGIPIRSRQEVGLTRLRACMSSIALRRKKSEVESTIQLVKKTVELRTVTFPEGVHQNVHDMLYESARAAFLGILRMGDDEIFRNYMQLFEVVLRVRQSCCHAGLVPEERRANAMEVFKMIKDKGLADLDPEEAETLLDRLRGAFEKEQELHECSICLCEMEEESAVILRTCKHIFCQGCISQVRNSKCPLCREPYTSDDMLSKSLAERAAAENKKKPVAKKEKGMERSPKLQAMLDAMDEMKPDEKGVIFSQWTSQLDLIQQELRQAGHTFTRIDGTMDASARLDAMEMFETEGVCTMRTPRFILCSLHACGTGINLTRGNVVFMMDPWWNVAAENQAMDRVHRIGQTRPVRVMRFLMKGSIEERMVKLQDAKAAMGKGSLERLNQEEKRKARLTALKDLFEIQSWEEEWL